jgi:hypothetical protein
MPSHHARTGVRSSEAVEGSQRLLLLHSVNPFGKGHEQADTRVCVIVTTYERTT